jgi:hypothetical protein
LKIAELAIAQKQFPIATNALETFLAQFPGSPAADIALLTLGELQLKNYVAQPSVATNDLQEAQDQFRPVHRHVHEQPAHRARRIWIAAGATGSHGKGSVSLKVQRFDAAQKSNFKMAAENCRSSEDLAVARFKLGDALFAQNNFAGALDELRVGGG